MTKTALCGLLLLSLMVAAYGQAQFNCDDARKLGNSSSNQCDILCSEVVKRQPSYKQLQPYCKTMCLQCVAEVQTCKLGAKQALPAKCQTAFKFPVVLGVINDYLAGKIKLPATTTEKGKP